MPTWEPRHWEYMTTPLIIHNTTAILNNWGAQGWELVQVVAGPEGGAYQAELRAAAREVVDAVAPGRPFDLVWQSRSGPPSVPWLEPDVNEHIRALATAGDRAVVVFPVGFVSDHLEVIWDLDHEARQTAEQLGLAFARAATAGTHPAFVATIRELLAERRAGAPPRLGTDCPAACCFVARPARSAD